jgi:hypothetical protein
MIFTHDQIELASKGYIRSRFVNHFRKDLTRIKIINRQLLRHSKTDKINLRLLLNNLILFFNCFNTTIGKLLLDSCITEKSYKSIIKTCLIQISLMTEDEWFQIPINEKFRIQLKMLLD